MSSIDPKQFDSTSQAQQIDKSEERMLEALKPEPVKPGYQTTEFWITIIVLLMGAFLLGYGVVKEKDNAFNVGALMVSLAAPGYQITRGMAKR